MNAPRSLEETVATQVLYMLSNFMQGEDLLLKKEEVFLKLKQIIIVDLGLILLLFQLA